jgi:uncharacterized protein YbaA (DUF1428 family)
MAARARKIARSRRDKNSGPLSDRRDAPRPCPIETKEETIMTYVDGFVVAVRKAKLEAYKEMARTAGNVWKELGAIDYVESVADDVPYGELTSFPRAVQATDDEVVVFAWITYESRAQRDEIVAKVMKDERLKGDEWKDIFDGKRMIYGGFQAIVEL